MEHNFSKKSKNNRKFFFTLSWLVGARFEGNCEGVHLASSDLRFFYWKHHFPIFLALFGTFWLFPSILVRFQRNSGFKLLFQSYEEPRGRFSIFHVCLFVRLFVSKNRDGVTFCNFLPFFLPPVKRTINLVFFFQIFKASP